MIETGELRKGSTIEIDGTLYQVIEVEHIQMGRGSAQVRMKLRDLRAGHIVDKSVQDGATVTRARVERPATARGCTKPAKLETGISVNVPLFINTGDVLKTDTRTGQYLERAA